MWVQTAGRRLNAMVGVSAFAAIGGLGGKLGIGVLAADLTRPEIASMPFFGSMR
jgi:hypothetical protein